MSTELHLVARQLSFQSEPSLRMLRPAAGSRPELQKNQPRHVLALLLVVAGHIFVIAALLQMQPERKDLRPEPEVPIVVSLVTDPHSLAEAPMKESEPPKPVIKRTQPKPKPKPVVQKPQPSPEPQPVVQQPVAQPAPASPVESHQAEEVKPAPPPQPIAQNTQPAPPQPAPVVEPADKPPPPESSEPEQVSGIAYLRQPELKYPTLSRRMREEGVVLLHVVVSAKGEPENVEVKTSSGFPRLDNAAMEAVKQARFIPYKKNNKPVSSQANVPIRFELN